MEHGWIVMAWRALLVLPTPARAVVVTSATVLGVVYGLRLVAWGLPHVLRIAAPVLCWSSGWVVRVAALPEFALTTWLRRRGRVVHTAIYGYGNGLIEIARVSDRAASLVSAVPAIPTDGLKRRWIKFLGALLVLLPLAAWLLLPSFSGTRVGSVLEGPLLLWSTIENGMLEGEWRPGGPSLKELHAIVGESALDRP